ncbi:MAG TPA: ATP-binding protein [Candidatus Acidoferrales bacterium]|nr:ATP-binding protein [Candidatus Acidoferrales bacterium]
MFKRWGIRDRMLLMALVPPTLIALILGFYVINLRIQELAQIHQDKGEALTRQMIPVARDALTSGNRSLLADQVAVMLDTPSVVDVVITDRRGEIVLRRSRPPQEELADASRFSRWLRVSERDETLFTRAIPAAANEDDILGEVTIRLSRTLTRMRQMEVLFNGTLIIGVGLLISYFLALSTSRDIVVPILRLTRAVRSFRRGQLTRRVPEVSGGELGTLERGINAMADALLAIRQELQGQIYQSNAELRTTLEELEIKNVELDLARQRAEEASRVKSRFLANMSHEIRTPINGILGFARLLADKRLPQDAQEYADIIRQSAENLLGIIEDILDFSRIEAGKLSLQPLDFNLHRLVEEVTELLAPMAFDKRLELVALIYRDVPEWVHGDVHRVRQVLTNLIGNAVKFTLHGHITVRAMLEDKTDTGIVIRLTVTDTGIGIDARQQQQIFQPFTQVDARATRQFGGTGLGLFISERLVRAMGGQIGLDSTPGKGSVFWFTVPLRPANHQPSSAAVPAPSRSRRVLVWDGFALGRLALRHCLENWGLLVEEAETFQHLLQRAHEQPTTVVIGLNAQGLVLSEVKAQFHSLRAEGCDIIALINSLDQTLHEQIRSAGALACLPKLLSRRELKARLCQPLIPNDAAHKPIGSSDQTAGLLHGYRLLVADDNRINLRLLATLLRRQGAEVDEVSDGQGAVEAFAQRAYSAVLLDVHMPVMSGLDAVRAMRQLEVPGQHTTILAVTANAVPEDWAAFRAAGMDDCLVKPVDENQLLDLLARYGIGGRKAVGKRTDDDSPLQDVGLQAMLRADLADQQRELIAAARRGDRPALQFLAHKIHGSAAFCRLPTLKAAAAALENELRGSGHGEHIHTLVQRLSDAMAETLDTPGEPHVAVHSSNA